MDLFRKLFFWASMMTLAGAHPEKHDYCDHQAKIAHNCIVGFKRDVPEDVLSGFKHHFRKRAEDAQVEITHEYNMGPGMMRGFSLKGPEDTIMALNDSEWVDHVVPNVGVHISLPRDEDDDDKDDGEDNGNFEAKPANQTHLARRELTYQTYDLAKKDRSYNLEAISGGDELKYHCPEGCGKGAWIYIIDDGVDMNHPEFKVKNHSGGRVEHQENIHPGPYHKRPRKRGLHGTWMAGIAAGTTTGVARNARIVSVNIFGREDVLYLDKFLQAMEWTVKDIKARNRIGQAIILFGHWGCNAHGVDGTPARLAVADAVKAGIFVAAGGGWNIGDTGYVWPGGEPSACTVMGWEPGMKHPRFPDPKNREVHYNGDPGIDIFAPSMRVRTSKPQGLSNGGKYRKIDGNDVATAHVAGVAATLLHKVDLPVMCETLQCWGNQGDPDWWPNTVNRVLVNRPTVEFDFGDTGMWERPECKRLNSTRWKKPGL